MNLLLVSNNLTSAVVVLACWWLAHVNARSKPPGRSLAVGYGLIGLSVLFTAFVRNITLVPSDAVPWMIVITKALFGGTLLLTIYRRFKLGDR